MVTGCSAVGSALGSGPRGRPFKPDHPDHFLDVATSGCSPPSLKELWRPANEESVCFWISTLSKYIVILSRGVALLRSDELRRTANDVLASYWLITPIKFIEIFSRGVA